MRRLNVVVFLSLLVFASASDALPAAGQSGAGIATGNFAAIDTDHDRRLDRRELAAAANRDFDRLDARHAGYLTERELSRVHDASLLLPFPGHIASPVAFVAADTDRDGKIDRHEYTTAVVRAYLSCDRNRDGTIELSDLRHCRR